MRRGLRLLGTVLVVCGFGAVAWAVVVWRWQDPFTALYTKIQQHRPTIVILEYSLQLLGRDPRLFTWWCAVRQETVVRCSSFADC